MSNTILIDTQAVAHGWGDGDFKDEMAEAFKRTFDAQVVMFCITSDARIRVGAGAALLKASEEDKEWVKNELALIRQFSAFLAATEAGLKVESPSLIGTREYSLMKLYHEAEKSVPEWKR